MTPLGVEQAHAAGTWIEEHILNTYELPGFDRYIYSPHRRTRETAGHLRLPNAQWRLNRLLREREWGEIQGMVDSEHEQKYPVNYAWMQADPLHWAPPGGESISQVADNRVRELFGTLHRDEEKGVQSVIGVTHGEWIWASRLVLDYMFNEDYASSENDKSQKVNNCQVVHYSRINPNDGTLAPYMKWRKSVWPWKDPSEAGEWQEVGRKLLTNEELLKQVEELPRLFDE